jgi:putative membrane protein
MPRADRLPAYLCIALACVCAVTLYNPAAGRTSWLLEVVPGLLLVVYMAITYRKQRLSDLVYVGTFVHMLILIYGGYYTYANTPLGNWAKDAFHLSRNHYDRVGHFALGFFPALFAREVLLLRSPLKQGGWLSFLTFSVVFALGAFWELIEWWTTLVVAGDVGQAFLGSQGDIWDAQWDMFLVGVGAIVALAVLSRYHDRSIDAATRVAA